MNIKRFNGNDFPGDKWVRDILTRVNEIVDYLKLKVTRDRLATDVTSVLSPITTKGDLIVGGASGATQRLPIGTDGQVLTSDGTTAGWEDLPTATATVQGVVKGGELPGQLSGTAISTGYLGQVITGTAGSGSLISGTGKDFATISLTPGVWLLTGTLEAVTSGTPGANGFADASFSTTSGVVTVTMGFMRIGIPQISGGDVVISPGTTVVNISSTTTYYLVGNLRFTSATMSVHPASFIKAIRIA